MQAWSKREKKIFGKLWCFHSTGGKCSFFLGSHGTALGSTTISYGQAMDGLVLPCLPCGDC